MPSPQRILLLVACLPSLARAFSASPMRMSSLVVISPPGGVGEVTAVKAATKGNTVKWFVISSDTKNAKVALSPDVLKEISNNGGAVELAGADASSLLEDENAVAAVNQWCANADCLVCTMDGTEEAKKGKIDEEDPRKIWEDAIKVASQQASNSIAGLKLVVLPAEDDSSSEQEEGGGVGGILKSVLGQKGVEVPSSLSGAMGGRNVVTLRHGELFGIPESSPNFSALLGGPRKDAVLCDEYTMRSVRIDPSLSVSGRLGIGTRSSRHAVGEVAALISCGALPISTPNLDVCVSSQVGSDAVTMETWESELKRVETMLESGQGAQLFTADFRLVPDIERLADWLATKWAPAVLRTYDIAAIRVGARPVYASRTDEGKVEIVFQDIENFDTVTVGKMVIQVTDNGIVATRAPGDAARGYGSISTTPLPGENVLVRRLAEAASQAIEKGLAVKPAAAKKPKPEKKKVEEVVPVTSVQSSGTVVAEPEAASRETGPRTAGARRSSERTRGRKKQRKGKQAKQSSPKKTGGKEDSWQ